MEISIQSLLSSPKLPYLHQSPILGQKGVQVRLKDQNATEKKAEEWHAELVTTCDNQWPSCFNARGKRSSQYSSCKLAAKEKPQTTEASYFHQKKTAATLKPVLADQRTQCNSPAAPLNAEQLKLAEEQLQREVYLAKKAFFLPDQESDSESDSVWDSISDMSNAEV